MTSSFGRYKSSTVLTIGYVPMTDAAPLIVASELGLFEKYGLQVKLSREPGWATIREKIYHGELDAAQAPASMVMELTYGYSGISIPCLTAFVTAHNGNAITLSNELWDLGVRDGYSLAQVIRAHPGRRFTFASVLKYSSQNYLIRHWLLTHGIIPGKDVEIMVVPPPQVHDCLKNGFLDGYCVAEPWSSLGLLQNIGWCVTLTSDFSPMHPEKVFMVTEDFHNTDPDRHYALLQALQEAAVFCDEPANRQRLSEMLSSPSYIGTSTEVLENALVGPFEMGRKRQTPANSAIVFHRDEANRPTLQKAAWVMNEIKRHKIGPLTLSRTEMSRCYREDIYHQALYTPN